MKTKKVQFIIIAIICILLGCVVFYFMHPHKYTEEIVKVENCTEDGQIHYECWCGDSYDEYPVAYGHDYKSEVTKEATCIENGITTYMCAKCEDSYTEDILATGHDISEEIKEAECEVAGYERKTCNNCDFAEEKEIPALEHSYELTEETARKKVYTCSLCFDTYEEITTAATEPEAADPTIGKTEAGAAGLSAEQQAFLDSIGATTSVDEVIQSSGIDHVPSAEELGIDNSGITLH